MTESDTDDIDDKTFAESLEELMRKIAREEIEKAADNQKRDIEAQPDK